jgi:hypothetical protein
MAPPTTDQRFAEMHAENLELRRELIAAVGEIGREMKDFRNELHATLFTGIFTLLAAVIGLVVSRIH